MSNGKDHHPAEAPVAYEDALKEYVEDYEMYGETADGRDASYSPNERERALIEDAIRGWEDPEVAALRAAYNEAIALKGKAFAEVDALRAERDEFMQLAADAAHERNELKATIARVRALADDFATGPLRMQYEVVRELRAALEGSKP